MKWILEAVVRRGQVSAAACFKVAAITSEANLCATVLRLHPSAWWRTDLRSESLNGTPGENVWNPAHFSWDVWAGGIPWQYLFALSRAYGDDGDGDDSDDDDGDLSERFTRNLEAVRRRC
jgi:hypothetical protein